MGNSSALTAADGHRFNAYVAEPSASPRGALVVVQEIFGVNSHIRAVADGFAADGYLAIAPSLFDRVAPDYESGYTQPEVQAGIALMQKITWDNATADVRAAMEAVGHVGRIGIVGYCWGGTVAWVSAARVDGLAAAVPYYGGGIYGLINEQPRCPVMLHFGESDASIPIEKSRAIATAHPEATAHFYAAGHGFNCDQRASFDRSAARLARERTLAFFREHVG